MTSPELPANMPEIDPFDLITNTLRVEMLDPYVTELHTRAKALEIYVQERPKDERPDLIEKGVAILDHDWRYADQVVGVSGFGMIKYRQHEDLQPMKAADLPARSLGFTFFLDTSAEEPVPRISHLFIVDVLDDQGELIEKSPFWVMLDDLWKLELPYPSPEKREQRLISEHPNDAALIDELAFTSPRDDQIVKSFGEYSLMVDFNDAESTQKMRDAIEYLKARAEIDPIANYRICITNRVIRIDDDGNGYPIELEGRFMRTVHINDLTIRPSDVTLNPDVTGAHPCEPFLDLVTLEASGQNIELLVPCSAIAQIASTRYDRLSLK